MKVRSNSQACVDKRSVNGDESYNELHRKIPNISPSEYKFVREKHI